MLAVRETHIGIATAPTRPGRATMSPCPTSPSIPRTPHAQSVGLGPPVLLPSLPPAHLARPTALHPTNLAVSPLCPAFHPCSPPALPPSHLHPTLPPHLVRSHFAVAVDVLDAHLARAHVPGGRAKWGRQRVVLVMQTRYGRPRCGVRLS